MYEDRHHDSCILICQPFSCMLLSCSLCSHTQHINTVEFPMKLPSFTHIFVSSVTGLKLLPKKQPIKSMHEVAVSPRTFLDCGLALMKYIDHNRCHLNNLKTASGLGFQLHLHALWYPREEIRCDRMSPMFSHTVHSLLKQTTSTTLLKQLTDTVTFHGGAWQTKREVPLLRGRYLALAGQVGKAGDVCLLFVLRSIISFLICFSLCEEKLICGVTVCEKYYLWISHSMQTWEPCVCVWCWFTVGAFASICWHW